MMPTQTAIITPRWPELVVVLVLAVMMLATIISIRRPRYVYCEPVPVIVEEGTR